MPISFQCPQCGKKLKAPDAAAGKSSKCPGCGGTVTCPEPVYDAEVVEMDVAPEKPAGFNPFADLDDDKPYGVAGPQPVEQSSDDGRRPCPMCGEMIVATAAKCRFCGEVFDPTLKKVKSKKKRRRSIQRRGRKSNRRRDCRRDTLFRCRLHRRAGLDDPGQAQGAEDGRPFNRGGHCKVSGLGSHPVLAETTRPLSPARICQSDRIERRCPLLSPAPAAPRSSCPKRGPEAALRCPRCKAELIVAGEGRIITSRLADPKTEGGTCAVCQSAIGPNEAVLVCPSCDQVHHRECWDEVGGCATYGCENAPDNREDGLCRGTASSLGRHQEVPGLRRENQVDRSPLPLLRDRVRHRRSPLAQGSAQAGRHAKNGSRSRKPLVIVLFVMSVLGLPGADRRDRRTVLCSAQTRRRSPRPGRPSWSWAIPQSRSPSYIRYCSCLFLLFSQWGTALES